MLSNSLVVPTNKLNDALKFKELLQAVDWKKLDITKTTSVVKPLIVLRFAKPFENTCASFNEQGHPLS